MRILVIDLDFEALDFCLRCRAYGHEVRWYQFKRRPCRIGEGLGIQIVDDWRPHMPWAKDGLIWISANKRFIYELDRYRDHGYKIFAPSVGSAELEIDRGKGMKVLQSAGIDVPPYEEFDSLQAAYKFARKSDRAWVFKTLGSEDKKNLTYVSDDQADLCGWIEQHIAAGMQLKGKCILQEKIDLLCEVCICGIYGPNGFLSDRWLVGFEHKKLMNGEIGPNTSEQGTVQQYCEKEKLADEILVPLDSVFRALGHFGFVDVNSGIDKSGKVWPFEFTCRPGWPQYYIQLAAHKGDPAQWMRDLLDGKDSLRVSYDVAIGVVMGQPSYPYDISPASIVEGKLISGYDDLTGDVHWGDIMMSKGPRMEDGRVVDGTVIRTAGEYICCVTAMGKTVDRARTKVYQTVKKVRFPDREYRTDIGEKVIEALPALHRLGYARSMN